MMKYLSLNHAKGYLNFASLEKNCAQRLEPTFEKCLPTGSNSWRVFGGCISKSRSNDLSWRYFKQSVQNRLTRGIYFTAWNMSHVMWRCAWQLLLVIIPHHTERQTLNQQFMFLCRSSRIVGSYEQKFLTHRILRVPTFQTNVVIYFNVDLRVLYPTNDVDGKFQALPHFLLLFFYLSVPEQTDNGLRHRAQF